jgi:cytochrome b involved in lipid metabolism
MNIGGERVFALPPSTPFVMATPAQGTARRGKVPAKSMVEWGAMLRTRGAQERSGALAAPERGGPITAAEVARHCDEGDNWMALRGVVYDVTLFQKYHPGGAALLAACAGKDATAVYEYYHQWVAADQMLAPFIVGRLQPA